MRSIPCLRRSPIQVDLFDRGLSQGETPRLWIDIVAHVVMGRDKRIYRFVQDTLRPHGACQSHEVAVMVQAVTDYVARRMIEREHALVVTPADGRRSGSGASAACLMFAIGFIAGVAALFGVALLAALRNL